MADSNQLLRQAVAEHEAGRLEAAEKSYRAILAKEPRHVDALQLLGVLQQQAGREAEAVPLIERAVALAPGHAVLHFNLGNARRAAGDAAGAADSYQRALKLEPNAPETLNNLASALEAIGRAGEAEAQCRRALALKPDYALAFNNLGNALKQQGRPAEALDSYRKALELLPGLVEAHHNAGLAALALGDADFAFRSLRHAAQLAPADPRYWLGWARALSGLGGGLARVSVDDALIADLARLLEQPGVNPLHVSAPIMGALKRWPVFRAAAEASAPPAEAMTALAGMAVFTRLIAAGPVADADSEAMLTRLRAAALADPATAPLDFLCPLALHCFAGEYVFDENAAETARADALADKDDLSAAELAVLACYRPLHAVAGIDGIAARTAPPAEPKHMYGTVKLRFGERSLPLKIVENCQKVPPFMDLRCAAHEYMALATGALHYALYRKLMPWDHAPGNLLHTEAGGYSAHLDGSAYDVTGPDHCHGFLYAPDAESWQALVETLTGPA